MRPSAPGFYYFRHAGEPDKHIWVAQVSRVRSGDLFATVFSDLARYAVHHRSVSELQGTWFGPLPSPESLGA